MIISTLIGALLASSMYFVESKVNPKLDSHHEAKPSSKSLKAHQKGGTKEDYWGLTAHDLLSEFGEDWAGSSTLSDGTHNPNEIVGWGSASASAWTQTAPKPEIQPIPQEIPPQQIPQQIPQYYYPPPPGYIYPPQTAAGYDTGYIYPPQTAGYDTGYIYPPPPPGYIYPPMPGYEIPGYTTSGFGYEQQPLPPMPQPLPISQPLPVSSQPLPPIGGQMPGGTQPIGAPLPGSIAKPLPGQPLPGSITKPLPGQPLPGQVQQPMPKPLPGGTINGKCPLPHRHRKPWHLLSNEQKDIFIDGFQQIRKNGKLDVIAQTHAQHDIQTYVHYTSLFSFYHAYLVWEVETAIRDLGGKFACFCMPYYDFTLDAGLEDDPYILHSGLGGDGDIDNNLCVIDDETGFSWQTCTDYTLWKSIDSIEENTENIEDTEGTESDNDIDVDEEGDGGIIYGGYDDNDDIFSPLSAQYIDYGVAYDDNEKEEGDDDGIETEELNEDELEMEKVEERCFWTQANCKSDENLPFCCLKRKKSTTVLLPTASEIGDAMYRSKNIKEWQGYLNEYYNKVQALFGADYYAQMANGYATEDPIFWLTHSFITHLRSLWQDCWNYNNIPKDKLDMHYNSYHPYCGTFDAVPTTCNQYNLALDAPMNFYELQKQEWSIAYHKIVTVRKMWAPEHWNVIYELGPFYTRSGVNNWCDNTKDSEWFIETMDYNLDIIDTPINIFQKQLREQMIKDGIEQSGVFKTVSALSCKYNRIYSENSCWSDELLDIDIEKCDDDDFVTLDAMSNMTLDDILEMDGVSDSQCLKKIRREAFAYGDHALQVKKQLCSGNWDYQCPEYNDLLYGQYASFLDNPIQEQFNDNTSFFAKSGWIWMIVINGILVIIVAVGCGIWHCSRSKTVKIPLRDGNGDIVVDDSDDDDSDDDDSEHHINNNNNIDGNSYRILQTSQEIEEYQPLLV